MTALAQAQATVFVVGWADLLRQEIENAIERTQAHQKDGIEILGSTNKRLTELRRALPLLEGAAVELDQLAETSGGEMWRPASFEEFVAMPQRIIKQIGAQYTLAYVTEWKPSLDHLHQVEVWPLRPGLSVRTRRSYYADDETQSQRERHQQFIDGRRPS